MVLLSSGALMPKIHIYVNLPTGAVHGMKVLGESVVVGGKRVPDPNLSSVYRQLASVTALASLYTVDGGGKERVLEIVHLNEGDM